MANQIHLRTDLKESVADPELPGLLLVVGLLAVFLLLVMLAT